MRIAVVKWRNKQTPLRFNNVLNIEEGPHSYIITLEDTSQIFIRADRVDDITSVLAADEAMQAATGEEPIADDLIAPIPEDTVSEK